MYLSLVDGILCTLLDPNIKSKRLMIFITIKEKYKRVGKVGVSQDIGICDGVMVSGADASRLGFLSAGMI